MIRDIIQIDEELCNGCGNCVPGCHEGALRIIDGKARLISDLMCDGLGACVGHCPTGAMTVVKREAEAYDEGKVMTENIIPAGANTISAHLSHLLDHGETEFYDQAIAVLREHNIDIPAHGEKDAMPAMSSGCPGTAARSFSPAADSRRHPVTRGRQTVIPPVSDSAGGPASENYSPGNEAISSQLGQWPVQLHLLSPAAPYLKKADLLLAADCTAYAMGDFHQRYLKGKSLAIACPKLDQGQQNYIDKLTAMIEQAELNSITVLMMEVPCCGGLLMMARSAVRQASRKLPIKKVIVSIRGDILDEQWVLDP